MRIASRSPRLFVRGLTFAVVAMLLAGRSAAAQTTTAKPATPAKTTAQPTKPAPAAAQPMKATRVMVDINHATVAELKNIPGIGEVYSKKIIAGRPYANKSQLLSRKIIDASLYETIQGMIIAKQ